MIGWLESLVSNWGSVALRILFIAAVTFLIWWVVRLIINRITRRIRGSDSERVRRWRTLMAILKIAAGILIFALAGFMILTEIGVQLGPMLATAGVAGIAIGLGAQSLVKDSLNGFFLMMENRIRVGDWVQVGGEEGTVEEITLLDLVLRDFRGRVHIIPHGNIGVATNYTLYFSHAMVEIGVAYREDPDHVMRVLHEEAMALRLDPEWEMRFLDDPQVFGINQFAASAVVFRVRAKTVSGEQWAVERELRLRLKRRFDREGIEIPFPHHTLYWGEGKDGTAPPLPFKPARESETGAGPSPMPEQT